MKRYNPAISFIQDTKTHMAYMKEYENGDYIELNEVKELIQQLADELEEEIKAKYEKLMDYKHYQNKFELEMVTVNKARELLK